MLGRHARLFDMHCHLDFALDAQELAEGLSARGVEVLSATVTPSAYESAVRALGAFERVHVGLGLHPWWIEGDASEMVDQFDSLASTTRFISEVGLDFGDKHVATREAQLVAFDHIAKICSNLGGKVLSLHAVKAAGKVLDVLEQHTVFAHNDCIFHWFSGTSQELQRASKLGCYFSVSSRMLASKRGRAYAQAIPLQQLLLETDDPPKQGSSTTPEALTRLLENTCDSLAETRKMDKAELIEVLAANSIRVFSSRGAVVVD